MLSVKNLEKSFAGKKVLDDVSFDVHPGQISVLLGKSGVGKSTILRALNNLESIDAGSMQLDDRSIDFAKVGMVFQDFNLFHHLTILENITLPLINVASKSTQEAQKIARDMLDKFGLKSKADAYPVSLSGGQKQRVALARTLAMNPSVLCLDEPTSALDPTLKLEIASIITKLAQQGLMIVVTTHDVMLLQQLSCNIHLMEKGKIVESATTQQLQKGENNFKNIKNFMHGK